MRTGLRQIQKQQRMNARFELPEYAEAKQVYSSQMAFEKEKFGGSVERTILRRVVGEDIWEELKFGQASWELSGVAQLQSENTAFADYHGMTVKEALKIDRLFNCPWFAGALSELLDAGCRVTTQHAEYKIGERAIKTLVPFSSTTLKPQKMAA